jgi:transcriptional regulator with XRE-family HTH domain
MTKDWDAVAHTIDARMRELDLTQAELAVRADVAPETVRELRNNLKPRRRNPRTLAAISEALAWPTDQLAHVLAGGEPNEPSVDSDNSVGAELANLREAVTGLSQRLSSVERRLDAK